MTRHAMCVFHHVAVLCTFTCGNRPATAAACNCQSLAAEQPQTGASGLCGPSGQAAWSVDHTLLGHSPAASLAGRRVGPEL
jgi:hypothetical protein